MTALDQAFLKAFARPNANRLDLSPVPARMPLSQVMQARAQRAEPTAPHTFEADQAANEPADEVANDAVAKAATCTPATSDTMPSSPADVAAPPAEAPTPEPTTLVATEVIGTETIATETIATETIAIEAIAIEAIATEAIATETIATEPVATVSSESIAEATATRLRQLAAAHESPEILPLRHPALASDDTPAEVAENAESRCQDEPVAEAGEAAILQLLRPALRLDRFAWPLAVTRLIKEALKELDAVTDAVLSAGRSGARLFGVMSCRPGEGATTVALSLARRLARPNVRVAVVDANFADPQLGRRLGLLADCGWEAVLDGHRTLADVMVESADRPLAVLPACGAPPALSQRVPETLDLLRQNYDVVLVDLPAGHASPVLEHLDAVVLVQHEKLSSAARVAETAGRLVAAQIAVLGVVQNFTSD